MSHPKTRYRPTEIAPDTFLIHNHEGEGEAPVAVPLNTMVIRAAEPVVVDTGMEENRDAVLRGRVQPRRPRATSVGCSSATTTSTTPATSTC